MFLRRRRLVSKLRKRFEVPYAMFIKQNGIEAGRREYDPLNDYGLGRATIPTSVGASFLKIILGWLKR